jgi:hypothetical protein
MTVTLSSGREVDNSCPLSTVCFAQGYCESDCPDTPYTVLQRAALLEHELGLTPHTDPDLTDVCRTCRRH